MESENPKRQEEGEEHIEQVEPKIGEEQVVQTGFGIIIIGPSGSGKSTLSDGLQQFMRAVNRKCCVVNLDPANENLKYDVCRDVELDRSISISKI